MIVKNVAVKQGYAPPFGLKRKEYDMMRITMTACRAVLTVVLALGSIPAVAADNLGNVLHEFGWDRIIGTWVDAETKGERSKVTHAWRFKDKVIETTIEEPQKTKKWVSLMGRNPKTGDVFHISVDNKGGSSIGRWTFNKDEAILDIGFVTAEKQEGLLRFRYKFIDDNTMRVSVVLPEPIIFKMVRVKNQDKKK